MLGKIIVGIIIGFASGWYLVKSDAENGLSGVALIVIAVISIAFIGSSFGYGVAYGLMAIVEIATGFFIASRVFKKD